MPLERTEERLAAFVEEVVDRTLLMPQRTGRTAGIASGRRSA